MSTIVLPDYWWAEDAYRLFKEEYNKKVSEINEYEVRIKEYPGLKKPKWTSKRELIAAEIRRIAADRQIHLSQDFEKDLEWFPYRISKAKINELFHQGIKATAIQRAIGKSFEVIIK